MRLIGWDTSSRAGSLVALEWESNQPPKLVVEWALNVEAVHSEKLLWAVDQVLESARWKLEDLDYIAVGIGPGSFTGLRIGLTTAKTLAHSLGIRLVAVSSLAALVRPVSNAFLNSKDRTIIVGATDACKGELFMICGAAKSLQDCVVSAQGDRAGLWKRGVTEAVMSPAGLIKQVKRKLLEGKNKNSWVAVGEAIERYPEIFAELPSKSRRDLPIPFAHEVQGRFLGVLAWEAIQSGVHFDPLQLEPTYLRASDAEVKLKKRLLGKR